MNFKKLRQMITVKGNGQTIIKEYEVSSFLHLHLSVDGHTELYQGDEEKVIVETDNNLVDFIGVTNSGKTLFITPASGYRTLQFSNLKIKVYFRQLSKLHVCFDQGMLTCANPIALPGALEAKLQASGPVNLLLDVPVFKAVIQQKGDIILSGNCSEADIRTQAEGNLFAREFIARQLNIRNMSEGNVEVSATETISITQYGEGYVHYWGNARLVNVNQRGNGIIKHIND
jgi:hypothetical protein